MTATTLAVRLTTSAANRKGGFDIAPAIRMLIAAAGIAMTAACLYAMMRFALGYAPAHPAMRNVAVIVHVATVLPAVPLGAWLLLAPKGTPRHKLLGKIWVGLMVTSALAIVFVRGGTDFSWIHIFVPLTLHAAWKTISTARTGRIAEHRRELVTFYLGALMIPGIFSFLPGRMMGTWLLG